MRIFLKQLINLIQSKLQTLNFKNTLLDMFKLAKILILIILINSSLYSQNSIYQPKCNDRLADSLKLEAFKMYDTNRDKITALKLINKAIEIESGNPGCHYIRGNILLSNGDYKNANIDFTKVISACKENKPYSSFLVTAHFWRSQCKMGIEDNYGAVNDLKFVIENDTTPIYFRFNSYKSLLQIYDELNNFEELKRWSNKLIADKYLKLQDFDYLGYSYLGCYYQNQNNFNEAIKNYDIAIKLIDNDKSSFTNLDLQLKMLINSLLNKGLCNIKLSKKTNACLDFSKAAELGSEEAIKLISENCK